MGVILLFPFDKLQSCMHSADDYATLPEIASASAPIYCICLLVATLPTDDASLEQDYIVFGKFSSIQVQGQWEAFELQDTLIV